MALDIDNRDHEGWSQLHHAAHLGDAERCRALLLKSADPNVRTGTLVRDGESQREWYWEPGETPLMFAAEKGSRDVVDVLLDLGASTALHDVTHWGPLHSAVMGSDPQIIGSLLNRGADVNLNSQRRSCDEELSWFFILTPLHLAALRNDVSSASTLISGGADISAAWIDRRTPLFYAAARGSTDVVALLCGHGADPNVREHRHERGHFMDLTPLHYAARNGHQSTVELLLRAGAEPSVRESRSGLTPEMMARDADTS